MAKAKPETLMKNRVKQLNEIFRGVAADKMEIVAPTIRRIAKMELYLVTLEEEIDRIGFIETYQNGENQKGTKESTASRSYSTVVKNYNALVRTLLALLPESEQQEASDGFEEFLQNHRRT